jgi:ribosome-associated toxin RatA of RatAB toxin-antitoxin module
VITKSISVAAAPEKVMRIMLNVTDYPTWQKEVNLVEIIERDAQDRPLQTRTQVSAMGLKTSYIVRYAYPAPDEFEYHLVRGDLMTKNDFTFTVVADAVGESQVTVTQDTATKLPMPGFIIQQSATRSIKDMLAALKAKAEKD